jgi:hypothetical protein
MMRRIYFKGSRPKTHPFPIVSWLIRLFEWSDISHNYTDLNSGDTPQTFDAHFNTVGFKNKEDYEPTVKIKYSFPVDVTEEKWQEIYAYCKSIEGKKHGYFAQLFGIALISPLRWFGIKVSNPLHYGSSLTCSQICRHIGIEILGFEEIDGAPKPENYYTTDFIKLMQKNLKISGQE